LVKKMATKKLLMKLVLVGLCFLTGIGFVAGCSSVEPYEYKDEAEEMPGPGLFTGEDGEAVIFRIPADSEGQPEDAQASDTPEQTPESERMIQP
jgi:hypothetical protein